MEIPQEIDDYIKESIDYSLGLPVSSTTLALKLQASEETQRRLRNQYLFLQAKLKEKDDIVQRARAESCINAQALKKFVEENQKLATECANLASQCSKWEKECSLYYRDREALMDFGNEAEERAQDAEIRVHELEEDLKRVSEELQYYKHEHEQHAVGSPTECNIMEEKLLDSFLETLVSDEFAPSAHAFLEANSGHESCQRLLKMWKSLRPSTQKVLSLAAEVKMLEQDKELLRINLHRAEEEVKVLAEENSILDVENKRLLRQCHKERNHSGSGGKYTSSASAKINKRKSSPKMSSPIEKMMGFNDMDSARYPLSPLENKSPDSRMHK